MRVVRIAVAITAFCLVIAANFAFSQQPRQPLSLSQVPPDSANRVLALPDVNSADAYDELLQRLSIVEGKLLEQEVNVFAEERPKKTRKWIHKVTGRALVETVMWPNAAGIGQNYSEIRQVRLAMHGTGYEVFDYRVQMDFEPEMSVLDGNGDEVVLGSLGMKDVYVGIHQVPLLGYVRVGHYKVPFSHDQMLSRRDMTFMERTPMADPNGFTPGREIGIAAFNYSSDQNFTWGYGAFFDSIGESAMQRVDNNQGLVAGGRVTWTPLFDEPSGWRRIVHLGFGALYTNPQDNSGRFSQHSELHEGPVFIDTGAIQSNQYTVINTELLVHSGPFYVNSEFWATNVNDDTGRTDLYSAYVETGWFLTGEHRTYNRKLGFFTNLKPYENFRLTRGCRGRGAWEIAARWSYVDFSQSPYASKYNSLNLALNWYLNPGTRVQLNWILPRVEGAPLGNRSASILGLRLAGYF